jgi:hypothetical protein
MNNVLILKYNDAVRSPPTTACQYGSISDGIVHIVNIHQEYVLKGFIQQLNVNGDAHVIGIVDILVRLELP